MLVNILFINKFLISPVHGVQVQHAAKERTVGVWTKRRATFILKGFTAHVVLYLLVWLLLNVVYGNYISQLSICCFNTAGLASVKASSLRNSFQQYTELSPGETLEWWYFCFEDNLCFKFYSICQNELTEYVSGICHEFICSICLDLSHLLHFCVKI